MAIKSARPRRLRACFCCVSIEKSQQDDVCVDASERGTRKLTVYYAKAGALNLEALCLCALGSEPRLRLHSFRLASKFANEAGARKLPAHSPAGREKSWKQRHAPFSQMRLLGLGADGSLGQIVKVLLLHDTPVRGT
jgi:hypothetical protein